MVINISDTLKELLDPANETGITYSAGKRPLNYKFLAVDEAEENSLANDECFLLIPAAIESNKASNNTVKTMTQPQIIDALVRGLPKKLGLQDGVMFTASTHQCLRDLGISMGKGFTHKVKTAVAKEINWKEVESLFPQGIFLVDIKKETLINLLEQVND